MKKAIFCFYLVLSSFLYGSVSPDPGCFAFAGEFLMMRSSIDQPYFVINSTNALVPTGSREANNQGWHKGYRVEGIYRLPCVMTDLRARWTHIPHFTDKNTISGTFIDAVFGLPEPQTAGVLGQAQIRQDFNFFYLDLIAGQILFDYCNFLFIFQAGVQYGYASFNEEVLFSTLSPAQLRILQNACTVSGWGPELGIDFSYQIWRCLRIVGRGSTALLVSKRKTTFFDNGTLPDASIRNTTYTFLIPTANLRLGINLRNPCDFRRWFNCSPLAYLACLDIEIEAGYEVMLFHRALDRMFFVDDLSIGVSTDELMDLSFHGPYVRLGIYF
jgi:hypothetical protein